ncbi:MAG TPA: diacylglycerol kinase family protein [Candidatus Acidoferrales bacterium]|jgi:YegS/Rv2252/BmrU family lipid kinase|nr:diacylglycerol kinase family protein [Candidatus Acidoferrales bacterium]
MKEAYFTIVNPAAGGGRCGKLAPRALDRLRAAGLQLEVRETRAPGEGTVYANGAYADGFRNFIAVGGDGTSFEIVNGIFPEAATEGRASLGFLPLGTGNSFLRDFVQNGTGLAEFGIKAILEKRARPCDVIRLNHTGGAIYYINTLNMGFAADVATLTNRHLKFLGEPGYLVGVLVSLARLHRRPFPLRADGDVDDRRCLFVAFSNSKYTGGKMMIAPQAAIDSGAIEYVHWGPIGRLGLVRNLPTLFTGTHIQHPMASRRTATRIQFDLKNPVDVVVDGEVLTLEAESLEVLPGALNAIV